MRQTPWERFVAWLADGTPDAGGPLLFGAALLLGVAGFTLTLL